MFTIAVAAAVAGTIPILPGYSGQVAASGTTFSERFVFEPTGPGCSQRSWPYYEARCLRGPDGMHSRPVRLVTADRVTFK